MDSDAEGCPDVYEDRSISSTEYHPFKKAIVLWHEDYEALLKEVEEYRTLKERTKNMWIEGIRQIREGAKK
jgi:hypothetical protein